MNQRKKNLKNLWADPRKRTMIIIMVGLATAMLLVGLLTTRGGSGEAADGGTGTRAISSPSVEARPGLVADQQYNQAIRDENLERLRVAQETGSTVLPTLEGGSEPPPLDPLANAPATQEDAQDIQVPDPMPVDTPQPQSVDYQQAVQPQPVTPPPAPPVATGENVMRTERYGSVENQIQSYMQAWVPTVGAQEFSYNGVLPEPVQQPMAGQAGAGGMMGVGENAEPAGGASFVRAGTIVPAVLLTSLNSDVPGPALAQIVSGPLAGARVIGSFQTLDKNLVLRFNTISMPDQPQSFNINAFAVDDNLGVGLATDVDNHYLQRIGLTFAAGLLEGYSSAIARTGVQTHITDGGAVIVTQDELSSSQILKQAAGEGGRTIASELAQNSRRNPTVKVEGKDGSGVPIGLLFMNDF